MPFADTFNFIRRSSPASLRLICTTHVLSDNPDDTGEADTFHDVLRDNLERMELFQCNYVSESLRGKFIQVLSHWRYTQRMSSFLKYLGADHPICGSFRWGYICWPHNTFLRLTHFSLHKQLATPTLVAGPVSQRA